MAEQTKGALSSGYPNPAAINPYGLDQENYEKVSGMTDSALDNLERRYATPNWFNVAAALAEPKLGGFGAAMGRAFGEIGKNVEKQKEMALPISQVRAQLAQSQLLYSQNKKAADMVAGRNASGEPIDSKFVGEVKRIAPNSELAKSLTDQLSYDQKQQEILGGQINMKRQALIDARKSALISAEEYKQGQQEINNMFKNAFPGFGANKQPEFPDESTLNEVPKASQKGNAGNTSAKPEQKPQENNFENFKIKPSFSASQLNKQAITDVEKAENQRIMDQAAKYESVPEARWKNIQEIMDPVKFATAKDANSSGLDMMKNTKLAAEVSSMLRNKGPVASLLAGGVGVHFGPYGASINVAGLKPALVAGLDKPKQDYYDKLLNNIAKSIYYDLKSRGIDPEKEGAEKFGQRMLQESNIDQGATAIHKMFAQNNERLNFNEKIHNATKKLLPEVRKTGTLTPLYDLYNQHPEIQVQNKMLEKKLQSIQ